MRRSAGSKAIPYLSLDLTPGRGNLLGESYWELISPWRGASWMLNTGPAPRSGEGVSTLSQILQETVPARYYLSRKACQGILRRARERGKPLPPQLEWALRVQAGDETEQKPVDDALPLAFHINQREETIDLGETAGALMATRNMQMQTFVSQCCDPEGTMAFAQNQRNEVRDLHDCAGALGAQPGMKQQTFLVQGCLNPWDTQQARIFTPESKAPTLAGADGGGGRNPAGLWLTAGFCAGAGPSAGGIGYMENCSPTLKASESGTNMVPSILCINDQGGSRMECTEELAGTLRAQEHGHQPLVMGSQQGGASIMAGICPTITAAAGMSGNNQPVLFENHGLDARYRGPIDVVPTVTASYGTGGNNVPLVKQEGTAAFCITGNAIDCQPENGGNGLGIQGDLSYTITATDRHAVYCRQRVDEFRDDEVTSTQSARQHKDATDLVFQETSAEKGCEDEPVGSGKGMEDPPPALLIRRLTPLECERLQGYPDGWTDIPGASDSARYKALGNSVAIPCVEFVMQGIALALWGGTKD